MEYGFGITNLIAVMQIEMHPKCLWIRWNLLIYCTERGIRRKIRYGSFRFLNRDYYPLSLCQGYFMAGNYKALLDELKLQEAVETHDIL